jgi:flagellin
MALAIATNNAALNAAASASSVNREMETSMARLSSGKRINSAADDAAGVAISSRLSSEIRGTDQAIRNSLDGQALIDTAEGAHSEIENILQRMREIAVQASNDTNNAQDRANLQAEMSAMGVEIDRIAGTTTWAGANLMDTDRSFTFQVGSATGGQNQIAVAITDMSMNGLAIGSAANSAKFTINDATASQFISSEATANTDDVTLDGADLMTVAKTGTLTIIHPNTGVASVATITKDDAAATAQSIRANLGHLGVGAEVAGANDANKIQLTFSEVAATAQGTTNIDVTSRANALTGIGKIDSAVEEVNIQRSKLGAVSNRLNHTVNNLTNISSNLSAAKGGIEDADFALETTNLAKNQILQQASTAMLAQANASKQNVLSLLQG